MEVQITSSNMRSQFCVTLTRKAPSITDNHFYCSCMVIFSFSRESNFWACLTATLPKREVVHFTVDNHVQSRKIFPGVKGLETAWKWPDKLIDHLQLMTIICWTGCSVYNWPYWKKDVSQELTVEQESHEYVSTESTRRLLRTWVEWPNSVKCKLSNISDKRIIS